MYADNCAQILIYIYIFTSRLFIPNRCVTIFTSLIAQLHVLVEMHAAEINLMVTQILPQWMQLFIQVLAAPISPTADVGLKTEVFRSLVRDGIV